MRFHSNLSADPSRAADVPSVASQHFATAKRVFMRSIRMAGVREKKGKDEKMRERKRQRMGERNKDIAQSEAPGAAREQSPL